jgi:hypothetical protein
MCRRSTQRAPRLRQWRHLLGGRARHQSESDVDGFLYRDIAGRRGVGAGLKARTEIRLLSAWLTSTIIFLERLSAPPPGDVAKRQVDQMVLML